MCLSELQAQTITLLHRLDVLMEQHVRSQSPIRSPTIPSPPPILSPRPELEAEPLSSAAERLAIWRATAGPMMGRTPLLHTQVTQTLNRRVLLPTSQPQAHLAEQRLHQIELEVEGLALSSPSRAIINHHSPSPLGALCSHSRVKTDWYIYRTCA